MQNETELSAFLTEDPPLHSCASASLGWDLPIPTGETSGWGSTVWSRPAASPESAASVPWAVAAASTTPRDSLDDSPLWNQATDNPTRVNEGPDSRLAHGWTSRWSTSDQSTSAPTWPTQQSWEPAADSSDIWDFVAPAPPPSPAELADQSHSNDFNFFDAEPPTLRSDDGVGAPIGEGLSLSDGIPFHELATLQANSAAEIARSTLAPVAESLPDVEVVARGPKSGRHLKPKAPRRSIPSFFARRTEAEILLAPANTTGKPTVLRFIAAASLAAGIGLFGLFGYSVVHGRTSSPTTPVAPSVTVPAVADGGATNGAVAGVVSSAPVTVPPTSDSAPSTSTAVPGASGDELSFSPGGSFAA